MIETRPAQAIATIDKPLTDRRAIYIAVSGDETFDLLIAQRMQRFGQLRAVFIDTSGQDADGNGLILQTDLGQTIKAAPGTQGYYPVFCPFVTKLSFSCNQTCNVQLYDFDVRPAVWNVSGASGGTEHVIIDGQPIATNATIQNWPAVQPVSFAQPIAALTQVQNFPTDIGNFFARSFGNGTTLLIGAVTLKHFVFELFNVSVANPWNLKLLDGVGGASHIGMTLPAMTNFTGVLIDTSCNVVFSTAVDVFIDQPITNGSVIVGVGW